MMTEDGLKDIIGAKYLRLENSVCFLESSVFVVEVLMKEHGKQEIREAKQNEIENLETYEVFEEVEDRFTVSKVEKDRFRFTGLDVKAQKGKIEVSMEDFASSVEPIEEIRKADRMEKLSKLEL